MLFWLEGDLARISEVLASEENRVGFKNLIESAIVGDHLLYGSRDYLSALIHGGFIDGRDREFIGWIGQKLTQDGRVIQALPKIRVSADYEKPQMVGADWNVPLSTFSSRDVLRPPFLLAENIRDSRIYMEFSRAWVKEKLSGYVLRFIPVHGGGNTTGEVLSGYADDGFPAVCCVVDSDKTHAADSLGQTAKGCLAALKGRENWQFKLNILHSRELENLIPSKLREGLLDGMCAQHHRSHQALSSLPNEVALYLCLKNGDSLCRFYDVGALQSLVPNDTDIVCVSCGMSGGCGSISGFGGRFILRVLESLGAGLQIPKCADWNEGLEAIVGELAAFGLGSEPHRLLGVA